MNNVKLEPIIDRPLIHISDDPGLEGNVNGPSLIKVPDWVKNPLGRYYLYFSHHEGTSIRLAFANTLEGPYTLYATGALSLEDSCFCVSRPDPKNLHPDVRKWIARGGDGDYPHIASPEVIVDSASGQIRLYYHGRIADGRQLTRVALSDDGLHFSAQEELLGEPYMRLFHYRSFWYGIAMPGIVYRSQDGLHDFEQGGRIFPSAVRHCALLRKEDTLITFWTQVGHSPEGIMMSTVDLRRPWTKWKDSPPANIRLPLKDWEGASLPVEPSCYGGIMHPVNQLRDPAVFVENNTTYLLYTVAGEQGIAIGRITGC